MKRIFLRCKPILFGILLLAGCGGSGESGSSGVKIQQLTAAPSVVRPGESAVLTVSASGKDLSYSWQAASGTLSATDANPVTWTAPSAVGSVPIRVEVAGKNGAKATGIASVLVSVSPTGPIITSVNPTEAKIGGEIDVTGAGFGSSQAGNSVVVGGVAASDILSWSDTEIKARVPEGASSGSVKVVVSGVESSSGALVVLWQKENPENAAVSTAAHDQFYPQLISDGAGGAIVVWADFRNGATSDLFAQRVNGSGAVQWAADGIAVSTAPNNQSFPQLVSDGAGGAIIVWEDNRSGTSDIYAQRVSPEGAALWAAEGIPLSAAANSQLSPRLIPDGSGGAIIVWQDHRSGGSADLFIQRVNQAGVAQWTADGVALSTAANDQQSPELISDGNGGAIVVWQDHRSGATADLYAQRIGGDGTVQWTADGMAISTAADHQQFPQLISDGAGGAMIVWQDRRNGTDQIYAQRVNGAGAAQWAADGIPIAATAHPQTAPQAASDGSDGAILTWQEGSDIAAQRVNGSGAVLWAAEGVAVSAAANSQSFPQLVPDGAGGAVLAWSDQRSGTNYDIYAQRLNSGGTVLWTANGVPISNAAGDQSSGAAASAPQLIADGAGGAVVVWQDHRSGTSSDIYAQGISASGRQ
ncbi:MAG: hypothetical protein EPO39_00715 [Candidatus Manganitrophaceae bacterium]|nr:MAG: hypothetical protein EPO39_00715 [Candidatus Manganitrophaceae bacterium]